MQILHWLVLNKFCFYMCRRTKHNLSRRHGAEQFNHSSWFLATQNTKLWQKDWAQERCTVINITFWAYLPMHCRNHAVLITFSKCRGKPFWSTRRAVTGSTVMSGLCPGFWGSRLYQCTVLCSHSVPSCENQSTGKWGIMCLDRAGTFDTCVWEYGQNRAWPPI